jgi:hypothetical protein
MLVLKRLVDSIRERKLIIGTSSCVVDVEDLMTPTFSRPTNSIRNAGFVETWKRLLVLLAAVFGLTV